MTGREREAFADGLGEPFCACGRRWSQCDRSRVACGRPQSPPTAPVAAPAGALRGLALIEDRIREAKMLAHSEPADARKALDQALAELASVAQPATTGEPPDLRSVLHELWHSSCWAGVAINKDVSVKAADRYQRACVSAKEALDGTASASPKALSTATTGEPAALDWRPIGLFDSAAEAQIGALRLLALAHPYESAQIEVSRKTLGAAKEECARIAAFAPGPRLSQAEREALRDVCRFARDYGYLGAADLATLAPLLTETTK